MVLVDTSVWISHFRKNNLRLTELLTDEQVFCHPFVIGELACGNLKNREEILGLLQALPKAPMAELAEILSLITTRRLMGTGLGFIDVHVLASALLSKAPLWTEDRKLRSATKAVGLSFG